MMIVISQTCLLVSRMPVGDPHVCWCPTCLLVPHLSVGECAHEAVGVDLHLRELLARGA